jgi:hypothetical protein
VSKAIFFAFAVSCRQEVQGTIHFAFAGTVLRHAILVGRPCLPLPRDLDCFLATFFCRPSGTVTLLDPSLRLVPGAEHDPIGYDHCDAGNDFYGFGWWREQGGINLTMGHPHPTCCGYEVQHGLERAGN